MMWFTIFYYGISIQQRKLEEDKQEQLRKAHEEEVQVAKLNVLKDETPYAQIIATIVVRSSQNDILSDFKVDLLDQYVSCVVSRIRNARGRKRLRFERTWKQHRKHCQSMCVEQINANRWDRLRSLRLLCSFV